MWRLIAEFFLSRVDDFCVLVDGRATEEFDARLSNTCADSRLAIWGFELEDDRNAIFLNRVLTVNVLEEPNAILHEPDARHARLMIRELGLRLCRHATSPSFTRITKIRFKYIFLNSFFQTNVSY